MCVRVEPFRRASGPVASAGAGVEVVCVAPSGAAVSTHHIRTRPKVGGTRGYGITAIFTCQ